MAEEIDRMRYVQLKATCSLSHGLMLYQASQSIESFGGECRRCQDGVGCMRKPQTWASYCQDRCRMKAARAHLRYLGT